MNMTTQQIHEYKHVYNPRHLHPRAYAEKERHNQ